MKKILSNIALSTVLAGAASGANAYYVDQGSSLLNGNALTDYSTTDLVSFDVDFNSAAPVTLTVVKEAGDSGAAVFNSLLNNFFGEGFAEFSLTLSGATFAVTGDINPFFGESVSITNDTPSEVSFTIDGATFDGVMLGDSFVEGFIDWEIDTSALSTGGSFDLTIAPTAVPAPAAFWLMLSALTGLVSLHKRSSAK